MTIVWKRWRWYSRNDWPLHNLKQMVNMTNMNMHPKNVATIAKNTKNTFCAVSKLSSNSLLCWSQSLNELSKFFFRSSLLKKLLLLLLKKSLLSKISPIFIKITRALINQKFHLNNTTSIRNYTYQIFVHSITEIVWNVKTRTLTKPNLSEKKSKLK